MSREAEGNLDRLEQQLAVMRALALSLEQSQPSILTLNAPQLESYVFEQQDLCRQWRELRVAALDPARPPVRLPDPVSPDISATSGVLAERSAVLRRELAQVEARIRHLNGVHAALLRYMRRSMAVLANLLAVSDGTYAQPRLAFRDFSGRAGKE